MSVSGSKLMHCIWYVNVKKCNFGSIILPAQNWKNRTRNCQLRIPSLTLEGNDSSFEIPCEVGDDDRGRIWKSGEKVEQDSILSYSTLTKVYKRNYAYFHTHFLTSHSHFHNNPSGSWFLFYTISPQFNLSPATLKSFSTSPSTLQVPQWI